MSKQINPWPPQVQVPVSSIEVSPRENLTVWLVDSNAQMHVQVELRVLPDGTPEVFSDGVSIQSFADWKPMEEKG